jgi:hypothetical protein
MAFPGNFKGIRESSFARFTGKSLRCIRVPTGMVRTEFPTDFEGEAHE